MSREVRSCTYYCALEQTEWKLESASESRKGEAWLSRAPGKKKLFFSHAEKKPVEINCLRSLNIFFDRYEPENWAGLSGQEDGKTVEGQDLVTVVYGTGNYTVSAGQSLPEEEKNLFAELYRFFTAFWEGTAKTGQVSVHSFEGGGPAWQLEMECTGIFTWFGKRQYYSADHEQLCGAGYDVIFELCPLRQGKGTALLIGDSPICPEPTRRIFVEVDEKLRLTYHTEEVNDLNGNWEKRNVIGTRIEIEDPHITVLWRNEPVLETYFHKQFRDGGIALELEARGMRYLRADSDYAELTGLFYHDGKLELTETFPITGESRETLEQTENSRYGNYDIVDEVLTELEGTWENEHGYLRLIFDGDTLEMNDCVTLVHVLRFRGDNTLGDRYRIVDQDPAVYGLQALDSLDYVDGVLVGRDRILDAPPAEIRFHKIRTTP